VEGGDRGDEQPSAEDAAVNQFHQLDELSSLTARSGSTSADLRDRC
jgi:hypothetical protein